MRPRSATSKQLFTVVFLAALGFLAPSRADCADITIFVSKASPGDVWANGYGAALSSTWFQVLNFEGEAARLPGVTSDVSMTSFTASAFLAPSIGLLTPYGGFGIGLYRQARTQASDTGVVSTFRLADKSARNLITTMPLADDTRYGFFRTYPPLVW